MHEHHRMGALDPARTGWGTLPAPLYPEIPRHLWGDLGLRRDEGRPHPERRERGT